MSFAALKSIPCPKGNNCTAFQCLFGHEKDRDPAVTPSAATVTSKATTRRRTPDDHDPDTPQTQGPPRKRQRTETRQEHVAGSTSAAGATALSKTPSKPVNPSRTPDGSLATQARPISPPPLKRNAAPSSSSVTQKSSSRPTTTIHKDPATPSDSRAPFTPKYSDSTPATIPRSTTSTPGSSLKGPSTSVPSTPSPSVSTTTDPADPAPKPRKAESLNPRFIPKAPSSFETRIKLVKLLHAEFARLNTGLKKELNDAPKEEARGLVLSDQQLIWKALDEEERAAVDKPSIYNNVLRNLIMQYKRMAVKQWREERLTERTAREQKARPARQHHQQRQQQAPKKIVTGLAPAQEVKMLQHLITPIDKLSAHGYVSTVPTEAEIQKASEGLEAAHGWEKCDRCTKRFQVIPDRRDEDGSLTTGGKCTYHWGKTYIPERQPGDKTRVPKRYRCCGQEVGDSAGCTDSPHHVFKATDPKRLATVLNFAETPANPDAPSNGAVCFDCEMCYTVNGLELVRLTATSWPSGQELLDVLVLPVGQILDLNSRFSGVWPDDLAKAVPWGAEDTAKLKSPPKKTSRGTRDDQSMKVVSSPAVARDLLFTLLTPETPLIGHGLENDLNSVRIIHPTIIDTVLLFPHKHGLPYRYGLKMLMDTLLNRKIQVETDGKVQGHDSAEDARAAGELVHLKVMEKWQEMRFNRWTLDKNTGDFVEPPDLTAPGLTVEFLEAAQ